MFDRYTLPSTTIQLLLLTFYFSCLFDLKSVVVVIVVVALVVLVQFLLLFMLFLLLLLLLLLKNIRFGFQCFSLLICFQPRESVASETHPVELFLSSTEEADF